MLEVILASFIGGIISLVGGILLFTNKNRSQKITKYATPFAAGALLSSSFRDLLPEASMGGGAETALLYAMIGILIFFLLERYLHWFHHHHEDDDKHNDPDTPLIIIGDTLHNFIDGVAIAAAFLVDSTTGWVVTVAVAAHEIPQEIGDFALLLSKGLSRKKVLQVSVLSALATVIGAILFYIIGQNIEFDLSALLGLVAGFFIYIAVSDIIPDIHVNEHARFAGPQTMMLLIGVIAIGLVNGYLHDIIDDNIDHNHGETHENEEDHDHNHSFILEKNDSLYVIFDNT